MGMRSNDSNNYVCRLNGLILNFVVKTVRFFFKDKVVTIRNGPARKLKRKFGLGSKPKLTLTKEEKFVMGLNFEGKTVFDIGAYIGIFTLFFARSVGESGTVVAFEPNPKNFEELRFNVELNGFENVTAIPIGVGNEPKKLGLVVSQTRPSRSTFNENRQKQILNGRDAEVVDTEVDSLDRQMQLRKLPKPDFVKIDVEGFEMEVLKGMTWIISHYKPKLFIEIHSGVPRKELVNFLVSLNYSLFHVESDTIVTGPDFDVVKGGNHLFCE